MPRLGTSQLQHRGFTNQESSTVQLQCHGLSSLTVAAAMLGNVSSILGCKIRLETPTNVIGPLLFPLLPQSIRCGSKQLSTNGSGGMTLRIHRGGGGHQQLLKIPSVESDGSSSPGRTGRKKRIG